VNVHWLACAPLRSHERTLALLLVALSNPPSQSDVEALYIVAAQASATLENVDLLGQISRAYVNARELDQLKGEFINIAAHELRTPLAVLNGYARILRERTVGELREYSRQVVTQAERLQRIADDMLDLRFLEEGRAELHLESCKIQEVVDQVVTAYRPIAQEREQSIETDIPAQAGIVTADRAMLDLMLGSLISNAIKFSPRQSRVRVAAQGDRDRVTFQVEDQGKGLTLEESARVFDAFYQVGNPLTRSEGGIGLGLTLTREMVRAHGGTIWVESGASGGSIFYITLPRFNEGV
jgi:NtrC-family two-component system sensor histidine kinase KinB